MLKRLSKKPKEKNPHRQRQPYGDYQRGKGVREVEEGKGGINGGGRRFNLG